MAGLCFSGAISLDQLGVQAIQGILFIFVSENTFSPMYSVLSVFPDTFPLFMRETKSGLYRTSQYYVANALAMLPGLIFEPLVFVIIAYWLAALRPTFGAFMVTVIASTLVMNVSTACGCFFSAAFNSLPLAMAYLVPFDYILMITSGVFIQLSSMPKAISWTPYISWMMYANEAMSIAQWEGVSNISELGWGVLATLYNTLIWIFSFNYSVLRGGSKSTVHENGRGSSCALQLRRVTPLEEHLGNGSDLLRVPHSWMRVSVA